jgi:arylsulfatase A-like enzyme
MASTALRASILKYLSFLIGLVLIHAEHLSAQDRPNILVIMADDLGFSDLRSYGSDIDTPNLDRLAAGGLRFTQFYNASRCCPTRAALLTGKYPHEVGLRSNGASLAKDATTIAEIFADNGYHTAMAGKWHLTHADVLAGDNVNSPEHLSVLNNQTRVDLFGERSTYPAARGFQHHYGVIWGIVNFFHPFALVDGFKPVYDLPDDFYLTDALNSKTAEYIREFAKDDKPFFLYLAHAAPHWPLHARAADRAKYKGRYDAGWEVMRKERYARQIEMGLLDPKIHPLPPIDLGKRVAWSDLSDQQRARDAAKMETHAAMIDRLDQGVGDVIKALEETGQFDNTLIVFLSDNGASPEEPTRPGYDRPSQTPDGRTIRYTGNFPPDQLGRDDTWTGLGPALANACNTPFRFWKKESYHGGCASPFFVHWPAKLKAKPGAITDEVTHVIDLLPTFLEGAGIDPTPYQPRGKSLIPVLEGRQRKGHDKLFFEHVGGAAHRDGDWKVVRMKPNQPWSLYDLSRDRTETTDLAKSQPDRVKAMDAAWNEWWHEMTGESPKRQPNAKQGSLDSDSPRVANKSLSVVVEANLKQSPPVGVVLAQGGNQHGYAIHFVDGKPAFDVRIHGKVTRVMAGEPSDQKRIKLEAALDTETITLRVNDHVVAEAKSPGLIPVQPQDGLSVGVDSLSNAGDYDAPNRFNGIVTSTRVTTGGKVSVPKVARVMKRRTIESGLRSHDRALLVKSGWIRDPYIVRGPDDYYYLTGTTPLSDDPRNQTEPYNTGLGNQSIVGWEMQLWRTKDFVDWESLGTPFSLQDGIWFEDQPAKFKAIDRSQWRLWAPELHWVGDRWALVHTSPSPVKGANLSLTGGLQIQRPWSNPMGAKISRRHDPSMFKDADGWWLVWGATSIGPLKADFSGLAAQPRTIGPSGETAKMGHEGCLIQKIHGKYVLFGTGWSTGQGRRGSYNLYYATADRITGPYSERKFVGRFLGHGTPFQDDSGRWWSTAFYNGNVPPLSRDGIQMRDLSETAQTINQHGTTLVPLDVRLLDDGSLHIRAKDPDYAVPGPEEAQDFGLRG